MCFFSRPVLPVRGVWGEPFSQVGHTKKCASIQRIFEGVTPEQLTLSAEAAPKGKKKLNASYKEQRDAHAASMGSMASRTFKRYNVTKDTQDPIKWFVMVGFNFIL